MKVQKKKMSLSLKKKIKIIGFTVLVVAIVLVVTVFGVRAYAESSGVGSDYALNIALVDAGVNPEDASVSKNKFEFDDGVFGYDIEFIANGVKYEYFIKSEDGTIIKNEAETVSNITTSENATISLEDAKAIALSDAGISDEDATFTKTKLDYSDGVQVYDIEFYTSSYEYDYEIIASSGEIKERSMEVYSTSSSNTNSGSTTSNSISLSDAKTIALQDAGLTEDDVTFTQTKQDYSDGVQVYDIEFYTSTYKYEYEIRISDGTVVDKSVEKLSSTTNTTTSSSYISLDSAKTIAVEYVGISTSDVVFSKAKLETDDGVVVYEIEFYYNNIEYEFSINAITGEILEYDYERY